MNKRKIIITFYFLLLTVQCFSQTHSIVNEYKAVTNGKEMHIILYSDSTYDFITFWGLYHGLWDILENKEDSLFDIIYFYDYAFTTKNASHFSHVSFNDTTVTQTDNVNGEPKEFFVTMFDLTGESVPYYYVCFLDSTNEVFDCHYNPNKEIKHYIPITTKKIGMMGELHNFSTYFKCDYSLREGNIAFIIGPSVGRFYINKRRDIIKYRSCYCENYNAIGAITFTKYSNCLMSLEGKQWF